MSRSTLHPDVPTHWDFRPLPPESLSRICELLFAPVADAPAGGGSQ